MGQAATLARVAGMRAALGCTQNRVPVSFARSAIDPGVPRNACTAAGIATTSHRGSFTGFSASATPRRRRDAMQQIMPSANHRVWCWRTGHRIEFVDETGP